MPFPSARAFPCVAAASPLRPGSHRAPYSYSVARSHAPSVRRASVASFVLWTCPTPAHPLRHFAMLIAGGPPKCAGLTGSSAPPLASMLRASTPCVRSVPPQSLGRAHRASPSYRRVAVRRVPRCLDQFGPAGSRRPPPHAQGATLLARPRGGAVGLALRVAVAFAGRGLSPLLRYLVFAFSRPVLPPRLLRHSAIRDYQ